MFVMDNNILFIVNIVINHYHFQKGGRLLKRGPGFWS